MENDRYPENQGLHTGTSDDIRQKLMRRFIENSRDMFVQMMEGIEAGDALLSFRLAHTLKSNAGQLGLRALQEAAETVERQLKSDMPFAAPEQTTALKIELDAAVLAIAPLICEPEPPARTQPLNRADALALLRKTEALLEEYDTDCMACIDSLRLIPGSDTLVKKMEDFSFEAALAAVQALKEQL